MEIKRDYYLNKLIQIQQKGLIRVVTGICRCGKSYLINVLFKICLLSKGVPEDHIISMAFELFTEGTHCSSYYYKPEQYTRVCHAFTDKYL